MEKRNTLTDGAGMTRPDNREHDEQPVYDTPLEAAGLTDAVVEKLKRKHGKLYLVEVAGEREGDAPHYFVLKSPDRKIMGAAAKIGHSDPFGAGDLMIRNCLVWGDESLLDDMGVFSALMAEFEKVNQARAATIKNL
jgi:hypothetical protein